jgi:tetratricopeptide (TPR) repeat protein
VAIRSGLAIAVATIGLIGVGFSSTAAAQGACTGGGKISKQIAKPMKAAQDAQGARKWQEVLARTREAEQTPGPKSQFDLYWIAEFRGYAYHNLRQTAEAARELEAGLNNPCMPEQNKRERYKSLTGLYASLKNHAKVIEYGSRALKAGRDTDMQVAVAQAYYQTGNNAEAARMMNELLSSSGGVPKEQQLLLVVSACQRAGNNACVSNAFEKLVANYQKPEYWQQLIPALKASVTNDLQTLNVMRLALHAKVLKKPEDYKEYAQLTLEDTEKLAGEAQAVLEQGFATKVFVTERDVSVNNRLLAAAKTKAANEKAALAKNEAAAKSAATGDALVKVGAQYLSFGDTAKAIECIQKGIAKGNLGGAEATPELKAQRNDEAGLLLGIAYLRNNNKAEAAKAFRTVKRDPIMARIGALWALNTRA